MKIVLYCLITLLLQSCFDGKKKADVDQLNERVEKLEVRVDSLRGRNVDESFGNDNFNTVSASGHCQAVTKKGKPCKRKAKRNGYCWQHRS